ncbi:MAG: hypothetical protein HFE73_09690 [Firmicutes bacterium]|jgi:hypothetical protein|nr:hypothetical protein [Bacillota bacterium]
MYPLGTTAVVKEAGMLIAGLLPNFSWVATVANAFCNLSTINQTNMVNEVYTMLAKYTSITGVQIAAKFTARLYEGQWEWFPADGYSVQYLYD